MINKMEELFNLCKSNNLNCSISYQKINGYSVELYTGYKSSYKLIFYIDGCELDESIKVSIQFINDFHGI